ncbi:ABC transporter substrate-binding protein [Nocardia sp. NPDC051570]|uniref:ABC transporter substrate-binding protein n=1 Tax=Nocardia sp. NPDC051570 TaxID=3364324 RepID=UPI0037BD45F9
MTPEVAAGPLQPGGTLRVGLSGNPDCLDPQQSGTAASLTVGRQLVDSLTDQDPVTGALHPWLASHWEVSPDARSFTFHLRPGVTFSDGTPLDAAAVRTNLYAIAALGAKSQVGATYLADYTGATVLDPTTVRVDFAAPTAQFLQATSTPTLGLLAPAAFAASPEQRCQGTRLIGSGPFVLQSYTPDQEVTLRRRDHYDWPSMLARHIGPAYLDRIRFPVISESGVRSGALVSGELDLATDIPPQDEAVFDGNGFHLMTRSNPGIPITLLPNMARPVLSEAAVRRAIQHGLDRQQIVDALLSPRYHPATGVLAASTPFFVSENGQLRHDPTTAQQLLEAAGWRRGPDGIRVKDGHRLSIDVIFTADIVSSQNILLLIQQQLRGIGVELRLRQLTVGGAIAAQASGDFDLTLVNLTRADPDVLRMTFSTRSRNPGRLRPGPLDDLLEAQATAIDPVRRQAAVRAALDDIVGQAASIPVCELNQVVAFSNTTHQPAFDGSSRLKLYDTWTATREG